LSDRYDDALEILNIASERPKKIPVSKRTGKRHSPGGANRFENLFIGLSSNKTELKV
jgi:hypothetical protein